MTIDDSGRARLSTSPPADRAMVAVALAQLSAEHRALLRRAYYDRWNTGQIAADLDIAEGSVKTQLHYALRALKRTLQDMGAAL